MINAQNNETEEYNADIGGGYISDSDSTSSENSPLKPENILQRENYDTNPKNKVSTAPEISKTAHKSRNIFVNGILNSSLLSSIRLTSNNKKFISWFIVVWIFYILSRIVGIFCRFLLKSFLHLTRLNVLKPHERLFFNMHELVLIFDVCTSFLLIWLLSHRFITFLLKCYINIFLRKSFYNNGTFDIHVDWISFRGIFDLNQLIIRNLVWRNPPTHKTTPYILYVKELSVSFSLFDFLSFTRTGKLKSIKLGEIMIDTIDIYFERAHTTYARNSLNLWAAMGVTDKSKEKTLLKSMIDAIFLAIRRRLRSNFKSVFGVKGNNSHVFQDDVDSEMEDFINKKGRFRSSYEIDKNTVVPPNTTSTTVIDVKKSRSTYLKRSFSSDDIIHSKNTEMRDIDNSMSSSIIKNSHNKSINNSNTYKNTSNLNSNQVQNTPCKENNIVSSISNVQPFASTPVSVDDETVIYPSYDKRSHKTVLTQRRMIRHRSRSESCLCRYDNDNGNEYDYDNQNETYIDVNNTHRSSSNNHFETNIKENKEKNKFFNIFNTVKKALNHFPTSSKFDQCIHTHHTSSSPPNVTTTTNITTTTVTITTTTTTINVNQKALTTSSPTSVLSSISKTINILQNHHHHKVNKTTQSKISDEINDEINDDNQNKITTINSSNITTNKLIIDTQISTTKPNKSALTNVSPTIHPSVVTQLFPSTSIKKNSSQTLRIDSLKSNTESENSNTEPVNETLTPRNIEPISSDKSEKSKKKSSTVNKFEKVLRRASHQMVAPFITTTSTIYQNEKYKYNGQSSDISVAQNQAISANDSGENNISEHSAGCNKSTDEPPLLPTMEFERLVILNLRAYPLDLVSKTHMRTPENTSLPIKVNLFQQTRADVTGKPKVKGGDRVPLPADIFGDRFGDAFGQALVVNNSMNITTILLAAAANKALPQNKKEDPFRSTRIPKQRIRRPSIQLWMQNKYSNCDTVSVTDETNRNSNVSTISTTSAATIVGVLDIENHTEREATNISNMNKYEPRTYNKRISEENGEEDD